MTNKYDDYGDRCRACGCFLGSVDKSTENGFDWDYICNNKKCRSNNIVTTIPYYKNGEII